MKMKDNGRINGGSPKIERAHPSAVQLLWSKTLVSSKWGEVPDSLGTRCHIYTNKMELKAKVPK